MKVLAIDPGNELSAYVIWDGEIILAKGKVSNYEVLDVIESYAYDAERYEGDSHVVIEMVASYGMAVGQTVFDTCVWIGRFQEQAISFMGNTNTKTYLVFRKDVKLYWCGQTRAKDSNIIQAIKDRYGEKGTKKHGFNKTYNDEEQKMKADIWQAFALAVQAFEEVV